MLGDHYDLFEDIVKALSLTMDLVEQAKHQHAQRVAGVAANLAKAIDLNDTDIRDTYYAGLIHDIAQALFTVGGVGDIVISMEDSADLYATAGDTLTATSGTGIATQGAISVADNSRGHPGGTLVIRFATDKRYVRFNGATVADDLGTCWVTLETESLDKL